MKRLLILLLFTGMFACSDMPEESNSMSNVNNLETITGLTRSADGTTIVTGDPEMILGEHLQNPYSVENMERAYLTLPAETKALEPYFSISPTHKYIKIDITDTTLDALLEIGELNDFDYFDYPLDYEILQEGIYRDPELINDTITYNPVYTAVPINFNFPDSINVTILAELFLPNEDFEGGATRAPGDYNPDFTFALVNAAMTVTGNTDDIAGPATRASKWYPAGRITAWDDAVQGNVPLHGAKVRCRRWFTFHRAYTDENGYFRMDKGFERPGNYSIVWSRKYWNMRGGNIGRAIFNGPKIRGDWNLNITGGNSIHYATVHRALMRWYYGDVGGLSRPLIGRGIKIKIKDNKKQTNSFNMSGNLSMGLLCDIDLHLKGNDTWETFATASHELGHAAHYSNSTFMNYWAHSSTFMKESWASFCGWYLTKLEYTELGVYDNIVPPNKGKSYIIGWEYPNGSSPWGTKKQPVYAWGETIEPYLNKGTWRFKPNDETSNYSPFFIGLMERSNFGELWYNGDVNYPDDDIRGMPAREIQKLCYESINMHDVMDKLKRHIGQIYEEQLITQDIYDRYIRVYRLKYTEY